jgi:hypothetical protein
MPKKQDCENQAENTLNTKSRTLICFMIIDPRHGIKFSYFGGNLLTESQIVSRGSYKHSDLNLDAVNGLHGGRTFDKIDRRSKCE